MVVQVVLQVILLEEGTSCSKPIMPHDASTIYYILGSLSIICLAVWRTCKFFIHMDDTVVDTAEDVKTIMTNHLPHLYGAIGEIQEHLNVRKN